jgi:Tfp pilus assembly protein PilF
MENNRLIQLRAILEKEPEDSFALYALGLEYASMEDFDKARETFENLIRVDDSYLGTYYQLGKVYERLGENSLAREIYEKGILLSASLNDNHTRGELEQALDEL